MRSRASSRSAGARGIDLSDAANADQPDENAALNDSVEHLTQDQMLVNQALVERIFASQQAEAALRVSEHRLHDLLAHQHANREAERKRISRDIHDLLAQNLLALRMDIVSLQQATADRHRRLHERLGAALDNVDTTLRAAKQLLGELRPACLELGLLATLEVEVHKFTRASRIACRLNADERVETLVLDEARLLAIHRVLQESLNNVFRHSLASWVQVHLSADGGNIEMTIADNGIGFDPAAPRKSSSYGLLALQALVTAHGGRLDIASARGQGTRVILLLPCASTPFDASGQGSIG